MKKLSLLVMMFFVAGWISAQNITVELPELPSPGATITVPLTVTAIDASVLTFQVYVQYDPAVLTYSQTLYPNTQFPQIEWVAGAAGGEWGANWFGADFLPEAITAPAVLCEVEFTYNGGDTPLTWGLAEGGAPIKGQTLFFDEFFNTFNQTLVDGCVAGSCVPPATARVQAIHNSADAAAAVVDVWLDDTKIIDDFAFRTASPFIDAPAGVQFTLVIADPASTDPNTPIWSQNYTLAEGETYILVAEGIVSATGYSPATPFDIAVYDMGQEAALVATNTDVLVHHGSTDAPVVDVFEIGVGAGQIVDDIAYSEFQGYLELPTADYILDVRDATGTTSVAAYKAPLSTLGLDGAALVTVASGFLDPSVNSNGPAFGLWVALPAGGPLVELPGYTPARVQAIHNSADAAAAVVDVWLNDTKIIDDFAFRTASPFIDAPAGIEFTLVVADPASTDPNTPIWSNTYTLAEGETYVLVANGIVSATGYNPSTPFDIYVYDMGQEAAADPGNVDVLAFHGSTDAPTVDVYEVGVGAGLLIDDLMYGDFAGYLPLAVNDYLISVRDETGTATVAIYSAPLATLGLGGEAAVICASGFLDPSVNSSGPGFGLWVALPAGGPLVELPLYMMREWDGSESTDWYNPLNWDVEDVPGIDDNALIPDGMPNYPEISFDGISVALCNDLTIQSNASLLLNPDGFMTVFGTCTNEGFLGVLGDVAFSGSFVCTDIQGAGSYQYWRTLEVNAQPDPEQEGWHYISSPTQGFSSYNMYDYYINTWDEPTANWVNHGSNTPCVPADEIFNDGMYGWSVKWDDMYSTYGCPNPGTGNVVEFIGPFNDGNQMGMATYSGTGTFTGFNLIGNPYPSWWNYDAFFGGANWPAGLNDAIYFWDESSNQYASYVGGTGNNGGTPFVPPTQAFFIEADGSEASINLTFTPSEQAHVIGLDYWKSEATDLVRLEVTGNGYADQTTIKFNENATVNRDKIDARKLYSGGQQVPSLWTLGGDVELSINQMPAADEVPVYFDCPTSGSFSIEAVETSDYSILILEDKFTGEETDLLSSGHSFEHTSGANTDRFVLHYKTTGIGDNELTNVSIWSGDQKIFVRTDVTARGDITVFNMMGQEVVRTDIEPGLNTIPMYDVNTYYVVKVTTSEGVETGKVFIK